MSDSSTSYDRVPLALAGVLAAFLAAGLAAVWLGPPAAEPHPGLPDLSNAHLAEVRDASGRTVLSGEFRERTDALGNIERDAHLSDRRGRRVIGEVDIQLSGPDAIAAGQELDIDIIELDPNAKYTLFVDDREVASFTTDDRGSIDLERHSIPPAPRSPS